MLPAGLCLQYLPWWTARGFYLSSSLCNAGAPATNVAQMSLISMTRGNFDPVPVASALLNKVSSTEHLLISYVRQPTDKRKSQGRGELLQGYHSNNQPIPGFIINRLAILHCIFAIHLINKGHGQHKTLNIRHHNQPTEP